MRRHRVKILDAGFVLVVLAALTLVAFYADVFENESKLTQHKETIELDEMMLLSLMVMAGVLFYTWRRAVEHKREAEHRRAAEREVLCLALQDPLTGLPNRRQFDGALKTALASAPTAPMAHAVFLLDLNGFKKINDVYGHPVGDQALIHVGSRLMRAVRDGDLVARLGGDEFAILARNVSGVEGATTIALRIIESITPPVNIDGIRHQVGAAIGVALSPQDGASGEELLRKADVALYRAKKEGRSAVRFFEEHMDASLRERAALENALGAAIENDSLTVDFLPTSSIGGESISGFEALPRWIGPSGLIEPERFLPIAEEAGLLAQASEQLLRKACAAAKTWPNHVRLAFNLPSPLLLDSGFGLRILSVLSGTGLSPTRLDLEIDEGALIREAAAAQPLLRALRQAGISIVADHFGTGYSDLQNLHRMRIDRVKIDRSFIAAMATDRQAAVIVRALIGIGKGLDLSIVADGVTTSEQRESLQAQGCNSAQGSLYGGPVDEAQALALVSGARRRRA
ncbi:MAG: hypothetical protein JWM33_2335 [Caulobacteraceae bacterium]|nr:hypothetical protein [Caulobacteraceae bacterium]